MLMNIPEEVAQRRETLAAQQGSSVGALLNTLLNRYTLDSPPGSLAQMAQNAREAALISAQTVATAERSREILSTEYADYLKHRMDQGTDDDHHR